MGHYQGNLYGPCVGASLEHLVLSNSRQYFKNPPSKDIYATTRTGNGGEATEKWRAAAKKVGSEMVALKHEEEDEELLLDSDNPCNKKWCWWAPSQASISVAFCNETSIHGFKFMGQAKRHFTERLFWVIAFCGSFGLACYLIYNVWDKYKHLPVIVSFQSSEQGIDSIPFPAVTICNMNKFPKSKVRRLEEITKNIYHPEYFRAKQQLMFVRSVCNARQSFAKQFDYAFKRGEMQEHADADNDVISEDSQDDMMEFLLTNTLPCGKLLRLCILGEQERNCSELFKPIITDYGKCCVFNILPLPILLKNPQNANKPNASIYDNPVLGNQKIAEIHWPEKEIKEWKKWNYDEGFVLDLKSKLPWKQKRAGLPYGLSLLVDPHTEEYFCPVSDSEGIRYILHTTLEMPHVMEFSSVADLGKEILIEVHPDMTNADDDIRDIEHYKRKCFFGTDQSLRFFGPYTGGNCVDECTAIFLGKECKCTYFYMPRDDGVKICNNDPDSEDFKCIEKARFELQANINDICADCDTLCEDIAYNYETTIATLQNSSALWGDVDPVRHPEGVPDWAGNKMSVIHVFFGSDTTVPKCRKKLYGITDLIANTGGILGLCLGFSILSGAEVLYFITLRSFWKYCRKRRAGKQRAANKVVKMFSKGNNKVIRMNANDIPIYPAYQHQRYGGGGGGNGNNIYGGVYGGDGGTNFAAQLGYY